MRKKKAQMEIMGLLVIVLIFIVALMFVLFFVSRGSIEDSLRTFDDELHAYNTVSAIVQANTPCRGLSITSILKFAAFTNTWPGSQDCDDDPGLSPKAYASKQIFKILNESLGFVEQDYHFYVYKENQDIIIDIPSRTDMSSEELCADYVVSGTQPISYQGGTFYITLDICDRLK
ncbi:hypothetical protein KY336_00845 [Candidatus Woesearchaeota archaeon]|nr:hypothetical protein [Candidatus Woesearchaeota archaeon]